MKLFLWSLVVIAVSGGALFALKQTANAPVPEDNTPGVYDEFAKCISSAGAVFYGASWCSHCIDQKTAFGPSSKYLPYVECSTPDGQGQMPVCRDQKIEGYPTWRFADGTESSGKRSMEELAQKTGCANPDVSTTTPVAE